MYLDKARYKGRGIFSFIYFDTVDGKNRRLKEDEIPSWVKTEKDADHFCSIKEAEGEAAKLRAKRREEWKTKFHDFNELLEGYIQDRKEKAPNSWENDRYYLSQYAFHFFLTERACNNLGNWSLQFEDFRKWMRQVKPIKGSKPSLSYSTINHCIKALNTFLQFVFEKGEIEKQEKCPMYPKSLIRRKDLESVVTAVDERIYLAALNEISPLMAKRFLVAIDTGMRDSELAGLSIGDICQGEPQQEHILRMLKKNEIKCLGYIVLQDQVVDGERPRNSEGDVVRKPLKHKKSVCAANNRIIPIERKDTWNALVQLFNEQQEKFGRREYGTNRKNYLLFDGIAAQTYRNALVKVAAKTKCRYYTPHDCRHTFATRLAGRTGGDYALCSLVLGHKDLATTENYLHIFEYMQSDLANKRVVEEGLELVE